ncbi:hypothetical protein [Streptomyces sp. NRRL S-920]|uniref:hypothetical protein n=1 Tax=Streptomyces sp. NRRL S-920 TaxID=1463921 RepID=UPI00068CC44B|nr:hypothetical protein [Streptomyces sp. NRRL S-920]
MRRQRGLRAVLLAAAVVCTTALAGSAQAQAAPASGAASASAATGVGPVQLRYTGTGGGPQNIARRAATEAALAQAAATGFSASQCRETNGTDFEHVGGYWTSIREVTCVGEPAVAAAQLDLYRYLKPGKDHLSSVWHVPDGYNREGSMGRLHTAPKPGTHPLYLCVVRGDHFLTTDVNCEGQQYVTRLGWIQDAPQPGVPSAPLYRCLGGGRQLFESNDPNCEGMTNGGGPLGYTLTG